MVEVYSHSKLSLYEQCPESYKIKYVEKTMPELPPSVHAYLGSMVHESLEWFYSELMFGRKIELDELIKKFAEKWHENFDLNLRIPENTKVEDFFNKGVKFLVDYYRDNFPFAEETIDLERKIYFPLDEGIYITGFIDRIVKTGFWVYEVHDYKTNERIKTQEQVDIDRQLAFYHLGLQNLFGEDIKVKLVWHFLAHGKKVFSFRSKEQLENLRLDTLKLIEKIKNEKNWTACGKPWCDWCVYKRTMKFTNSGNNDLRRFF